MAQPNGSSPGRVTRLLREARAGDANALEQVLPLVYEELRRLARRHLRFEADGQLFGHGGCNHFFGSYTAGEGGKLEIGPLGATRMACPQEIMNKEMAFMAMLGTTASYIRRGIELDLKDGAGVIAATLTQRDAD